MVSSLLPDALANPTAVLLDLFHSSPDLDEFPSRVITHFTDIFSTNDALNEVTCCFHVLKSKILTYNRFHLSMFIIHQMHIRTDPWSNSLP
jgi:hypothetical protein